MIIIQGSSRKDGHTQMISEYLIQLNIETEIIVLCDHVINDFSYDGRQNDDFLSLIEQILIHETIIWVTPVYWYTISATMKRFLDRFSDLLKWDKPIGRKLRGKNMMVISNSGSDDAPKHFEEPFRLSAHYLGMKYLGYCHTWIENEAITEEAKERIHYLISESY